MGSSYLYRCLVAVVVVVGKYGKAVKHAARTPGQTTERERARQFKYQTKIKFLDLSVVVKSKKKKKKSVDSN